MFIFGHIPEMDALHAGFKQLAALGQFIATHYVVPMRYQYVCITINLISPGSGLFTEVFSGRERKWGL